MADSILIVGAGPTGLVLALWLAKAGVACRIIEQHSGPGQASRAMAIQARTLEFYRQLGIAQEIVDRGIKVRGVQLRKGHRAVAGFPFENIGSDISLFQFVLSLPQDDHERLLVTFLERVGIRVEWNTQLVRFNADEHRVSATLRKPDGEETSDFAYLCGCDGVHSTVRQTLGLNFPGGTYEEEFYVADVEASGLAFNEDVDACLSAHSFGLAFPVRSSGMFRLIGIVPRELAGHEQLTFDDIRPHVKKQMDADIGRVNWFSTYRVHHRVADHFRRGRVFIAGDAGHVHSPAGGQGMNTGIGDAVNLAWKLAAVVRGRADPSILETYEPERIAFARTLVATTDRVFEAIVGRSVRSTIIRDIVIPYVAPFLLRFRAVRKAQFRLVSQTRIQYRASPLSIGAAGKIHGGDRLAWVQSQDNHHPLNSLDWQIHIYGTPTDTFRDFAALRGLPVHSFSLDEHARSAGYAPGAVYLVRPDGHVAVAQPDQTTQGLEQFWLKWMKLPSHDAGSWGSVRPLIHAPT